MERESWRTQQTLLEERQTMEILIALGIIAAWIILQIWLLPRIGIRT